MVNLRLFRRPVHKQKRLKNILLVGTPDREDFLEYLDIDVNQANDKGKNYRWKNRNLMNIPCGVAPRPEVVATTDVIIYFVDCKKMSTFEIAKQYSQYHLHVPHHLIVACNYKSHIRRSRFYLELVRTTNNTQLFSDYLDYDELETYVRQLTKKNIGIANVQM
jgi:hypothetical protein